MSLELPMIAELLFIFFARIIDVALGTIRVILIIRGSKWPAAFIGFFEILIYTVALGLVVGALDDILKLMVFCVGFSLGILIGSMIEARLAMGFRALQVTVDYEHAYLADELREEGYPVTCWKGEGRIGSKLVMNIIVKRNTARDIAKKIKEKDENAFIVLMEPKTFRGGYFKKK